MKKIQDPNFGYSLLKILADYSVKNSYRKFQVEGQENIPADGYTIWAGNHTNALMDALVLLISTKIRKVYVARADIFKNKKVAKVLRFIRIMPIYRIRDGIDSVKKNDAIITQATDVLSDQIPFVIFPEATHRAKHSLLHLSKGIFHIAYSVMEHTKGDKPVYIMPIGIEYGDYFRFRSTVLIRFGKPINISEFIQQNSELPQPVVMQQLRKLLEEKMSEYISFVPDDEDYDPIWEYTKLHADNPEYFRKAVQDAEKEKGVRLKGLMRQQAANMCAIRDALKLKADNPEKAKALFQKIDMLRVWRIQNGVSVYSIARNPGLFIVMLKALAVIIGLPYFAYSLVASALMWIPALFIIRGVKDDAFYNTARFAIKLVTSVLSFFVWTALAFTFLKWYLAIAAVVLTIPVFRYIYDYFEFLRRFWSDVRWILKKKRAPKID